MLYSVLYYEQSTTTSGPSNGGLEIMHRKFIQRIVISVNMFFEIFCVDLLFFIRNFMSFFSENLQGHQMAAVGGMCACNMDRAN